MINIFVKMLYIYLMLWNDNNFNILSVVKLVNYIKTQDAFIIITY